MFSWQLCLATLAAIALAAVGLPAGHVANTLPNISWPSQPVRSAPMIMNFVGAAHLVGPTHDSVGAELIGIGPITMAPFNGNFQNSTVRFNRTALRATKDVWSPCEGSRIAEPQGVRNTVRMPFKQRAVVQRWDFELMNTTKGETHVDMFLDGPYFRRCDYDGNFPCGWSTKLPVQRRDFLRKLVAATATSATLVTVDFTQTFAAAAAAVWVTGDAPECSSVPLNVTMGDDGPYDLHGFTGYGFNATTLVPHACQLWHATAVGANETDALTQLDLMRKADATGAPGGFATACDQWRGHWAAAFDPTDDAVFPGNLPFLDTNDTAIERLYGWASSAMVALVREGYPASPRQFVISEGPSNSFDGSVTMGGSGQFTWDLSFNALSESLLDPQTTKLILRHIIANTDFATVPMSVPQAWDGYRAYPNPVGAGQYCFDYVAAFLFVQGYVTATGDVAFLTEVIENSKDAYVTTTPLAFLRALAWAWKAYPPSAESAYLVDYGPNKRSFLEAAETYIDVIAALQAGNAGMLLSLARLLESVPSLPRTHADEIAELRSNGTRIAADMVKYQFVSGVGAWKCLKSEPSVPSVEVRCIADSVYVGLSAGLLAGHADSAVGEAGLFPIAESDRKDMIDLVFRELLGNGWVRALSPEDPSMARLGCRGGFHDWPSVPGAPTCDIEDLVGMRPDWTATGGYGGLAGAAVDAVANLEQGLDAALRLLRNISVVADPSFGSMPAQGIATMTTPFVFQTLWNNSGVPLPEHAFAPAFPEFFDEIGWGWTWPRTERSVQNAEASITDAIIRSVFGWRPDWNFTLVAASTNLTHAIDGSLFNPSAPRNGFTGTLRNVRLPNANRTAAQFVDITADASGLSWVLSSL